MKVYLRTFGCRANHYDTEAVRALLLSAGHEIVPSPALADAAVFNSCAVTAEAEADLRQAVRRAATARPGLRGVIMGCASALDDQARPAATRLRALPSIQAVVEGADLPALAAALQLSPESVPAAVRTRAQTGVRGLLRIQDGCDEHCTFCATTLARGVNRSRPAAELVREATVLSRSHAEIVITGIHIGSYGVDTGSSLGALLERLVREVPRVRFRVSSIEATEIDDRLLDLLIGAPDRVAPHIHAPLQSGSDRLLRRMGRHWYTSASYSAAVERLAARLPVLGLGADVIAGFPGETDQDHQATLALIEALPFTYLHVFPYSRRPGTAADRLPGHLPPPVVKARAAELRELGVDKAGCYAAARVGARADVVVVSSPAGRRPGGDREGLTGDYLTVTVLDAALPRGARFVGRLVREGDRLSAAPDVPLAARGDIFDGVRAGPPVPPQSTPSRSG